jgi:hypothetical protein
MLRLWADRLWSVCAGTGLVLLLAAEGNVCPHLLTAPKDTTSSAADSHPGAPAAASSASPSQTDEAPAPNPAAPQRKPQPLAWSAGWPDVMPSRRPWHMDAAAQAELAGRQSGTVACGPLHNAPAGQNQTFNEPVPLWRADRFPPLALAVVPQDFQARPVRNPALLTILKRTGPPC